jgi:hypothetical protein
MENNDYLGNQKQILDALLAATMKDYASHPDMFKGDIVIGANGGVLSLRTNGKGILSGQISKAVLPVKDGEMPEETISEFYPLEPLMRAAVFELHSFHNRECAFLHYEKGERKEFRVYEDLAQDGLLIRVEHKFDGSVKIEDVIESIKKAKLRWKPEVWFNGERVKY